MPEEWHIRPADMGDTESMRAVEVRAGRLFAEIGMHDVASHPPPPVPLVHEYVRGGRAWVAEVLPTGVVGFALADVVDGNAHLEQLSVDPDYGRRGIGSALIDAVESWAAGRGLPEMTLSTFLEVPFNGPYYARLGFSVIPEDELGPGLLGLRSAEADHGLEVSARVFMRRAVRGG